MTGASDCTSVKVRKFRGAGNETTIEDSSAVIVTEMNLTVLHRDVRASLPSCSPSFSEYLAVGHLVSRGLIRYGDRVVGLELLPGENVVRVRTERLVTESRRLGAGFSPAFDPADICGGLQELLRCSSLVAKTGAACAAGLCDHTGLLCWHEDIRCHHAVDKAVGHGFMDGVRLGDKALILTGKINSEIAEKAVSAGIPVLASRAFPTDLAVSIAERSRVTVIGFVGDNSLVVYCCPDKLAPVGDPRS